MCKPCARVAYTANPELMKARVKASVDRNPHKAIFNRKKARAKADGVPFGLRFADIEWPTHCPALGIELDYARNVGSKPKARDNSPSFDRVDPSIGYVKDNVVIISKRANQIKSNALSLELRAVADWLDLLLNHSHTGVTP